MWIVYIHNTCYFCKTNVANNPPRYTLAIKWCANWCTALHELRAYVPFCAICLGRFCLNHRITHDQRKTANWAIIIMRSCYKPSLMRLLMFKSIIQINTLPFQFDANNACWMCSKTNFFWMFRSLVKILFRMICLFDVNPTRIKKNRCESIWSHLIPLSW